MSQNKRLAALHKGLVKPLGRPVSSGLAGRFHELSTEFSTETVDGRVLRCRPWRQEESYSSKTSRTSPRSSSTTWKKRASRSTSRPAETPRSNGSTPTSGPPGARPHAPRRRRPGDRPHTAARPAHAWRPDRDAHRPRRGGRPHRRSRAGRRRLHHQAVQPPRGGAADQGGSQAHPPAPEAGAVLQIGDLRLDAEAHRLEVKGQEITLTATEFRLLNLLMERAGRVQTRGQLLSDVWGYAEDIDSRTVDTHVRRLRKKLGREADRIETVIGVGYRLRSCAERSPGLRRAPPGPEARAGVAVAARWRRSPSPRSCSGTWCPAGGAQRRPPARRQPAPPDPGRLRLGRPGRRNPPGAHRRDRRRLQPAGHPGDRRRPGGRRQRPHPGPGGRDGQPRRPTGDRLRPRQRPRRERPAERHHRHHLRLRGPHLHRPRRPPLRPAPGPAAGGARPRAGAARPGRCSSPPAPPWWWRASSSSGSPDASSGPWRGWWKAPAPWRRATTTTAWRPRKSPTWRPSPTPSTVSPPGSRSRSPGCAPSATTWRRSSAACRTACW